MKLLELPNSREIKEIDRIAINYIDYLVGKEFNDDMWEVLSVEINRKIGHSTEVIISRTTKLIRNGEEIKPNFIDDLNLIRIERRILKRSIEKLVNITIHKTGKVQVKS